MSTQAVIFDCDGVLVERGKPHPDLFLYAAAQLGVRPEHCLVVEDSPAGVRAAHAAGMRVIGFTGASHMTRLTVDRLRQAEPHTVVQSMAELADLLGCTSS